MPTIPTYGYDELEPSMLNKAKRRVIGLMDIAEETLTLNPEKDPTNGNQDTEVEKLTEDIYNTIKDIEILDTYVRDDSGIEELKLSDGGTIRPSLKKGAKQFALVNNALRRINATYDKIQSNMVYTNLKVYTGFINSVKILKKTAVSFFEIVDSFIISVNKLKGISYTPPVINDNEDPDIVEEPLLEPPEVPPILSTQEPFPPLPPAPYIPPPPPPPPPPPRPPRRPFGIGKKMTEYRALVRKVLNDANVMDAQIATDLMNLAETKVRNDKAFYTETELQNILTQLLAPAPAPLTETFTEMVDRITANLSPQEQIEVGKGIGSYINQFQREPTELEVQDIISQVINPKGSSSSSSSSIPVGIAQGVPVGQSIDFNALFSASAQLKSKIPKIGQDKLTRNEVFLQEAITKNNQTDITKYSNKLQNIITIGNKPFIKITNKDVKNLTPDQKKELTKLENAYRAAKQNLSEKTTQLDALIDFLEENNIGYTNPK